MVGFPAADDDDGIKDVHLSSGVVGLSVMTPPDDSMSPEPSVVPGLEGSADRSGVAAPLVSVELRTLGVTVVCTSEYPVTWAGDDKVSLPPPTTSLVVTASAAAAAAAVAMSIVVVEVTEVVVMSKVEVVKTCDALSFALSHTVRVDMSGRRGVARLSEDVLAAGKRSLGVTKVAASVAASPNVPDAASSVVEGRRFASTVVAVAVSLSSGGVIPGTASVLLTPTPVTPSPDPVTWFVGGQPAVAVTA